jgi:hypothetical protein
MEQLYWLAEYDPVKIESYLHIPLWDYWTILDLRLSIFEKQKKLKNN